MLLFLVFLVLTVALKEKLYKDPFYPKIKSNFKLKLKPDYVFFPEVLFMGFPLTLSLDFYKYTLPAVSNNHTCDPSNMNYNFQIATTFSPKVNVLQITGGPYIGDFHVNLFWLGGGQDFSQPNPYNYVTNGCYTGPSWTLYIGYGTMNITK